MYMVKYRVDLPTPYLPPLFLVVLWNYPPNSCHELTQFRYKILRHSHLCGVVHVYRHKTMFLIMVCDATLSLLLTPQENIMVKIMNISLSVFKGHDFHPIFLNQWCRMFLNVFKCTLQYYSTHKHHLTTHWLLWNNHIQIIPHHSINALLSLL